MGIPVDLVDDDVVVFVLVVLLQKLLVDEVAEHLVSVLRLVVVVEDVTEVLHLEVFDTLDNVSAGCFGKVGKHYLLV